MTALGLDGAVLADEYVKVKKFGAASESHLPEPAVKIAELLSKGIAPVASAGLQLDGKYHNGFPFFLSRYCFTLIVLQLLLTIITLQFFILQYLNTCNHYYYHC